MQFSLLAPSSSWKPPDISRLPSWADAKRVAIDTETRDDSLRALGPGVRRGAYLVGVSFAIEDGPTHYLPLRHLGGGNVDCEKGLAYLRDQAACFTGDIIGANLQYDIEYLASEGIHFAPHRFRDVLIAEVLIDELQDTYSLDSVAKRHGLPGKDETLLRAAAAEFRVNPKGGLWQMPGEYVGAYAEQDVRLPLLILRRQERQIAELGLAPIYDLESRLIPVLVRMQQRGVLVDQERLDSIERWARKREQQCLDGIARRSGVRLVLGDVWKTGPLVAALRASGLTPGLTPTGKDSVDKEFLVAAGHPVADLILRARKLNKLRTTFGQSVRDHMTNGRIHPNFRQIARESEDGGVHGVRYGRMSCAHPNLQQQPAREDFSARWRGIYRPDEGAIWASNDYCFSADTEVLTEDGWCAFPDLALGTRVAQWEQGVVSYTLPTAYHRNDRARSILHIHGQTSVDLMVTPNHDCVLLDSHGRAVKVRADMYKKVSMNWVQPQNGVLPGHAGESAEILRLVVAIQADASDRKTAYRFWLKRPRKIARLREILSGLGLAFTTGFSEAKQQTFFTVPKHDLVEQYLLPGKTFHRSRLLALRPEYRRVFLEELRHWDGRPAGNTYFSTNMVNCETVQELAVLTGFRSLLARTLTSAGKDFGTVSMSDRPGSIIKTIQMDQYPTSGATYCISVPSGMLLVRRNGRVAVCGNSQQEPRWTTHFAARLNLPKANEVAELYRTDPTLDNHKFMASLTGLSRDLSKPIFLGLCYGEGGAKLCRTLKLPTRWALRIGMGREARTHYFDVEDLARSAARNHTHKRIWEAAGVEGQAILDQFNERAPYVRALAQAASDKAAQRGYIITAGGRRLHFPMKKDGTFDWTHKALNRLIQGSGADQMKLAMVLIDENLREEFPLQLQVHDEVTASVASIADAEKAATMMSDCMPALVPFRVKVKTGPSWGESNAAD